MLRVIAGKKIGNGSWGRLRTILTRRKSGGVRLKSNATNPIPGPDQSRATGSQKDEHANTTNATERVLRPFCTAYRATNRILIRTHTVGGDISEGPVTKQTRRTLQQRPTRADPQVRREPGMQTP